MCTVGTDLSDVICSLKTCRINQMMDEKYLYNSMQHFLFPSLPSDKSGFRINMSDKSELTVYACVCVCACACMHVCVRACVRACLQMYVVSGVLLLRCDHCCCISQSSSQCPFSSTHAAQISF